MSLITITAGLGGQGPEIAQKTARQLKVDLFDDQRLQEEAVKMGVSPEEMKMLDEKKPGLLDRLFSRKPEIYRSMMESLIYDVSKRGKGVITGHGAAFLLRDFSCAFHVRLDSSRKWRAKALADARGMSPEAAEKIVDKNDRDQAGFIRFCFQKDWKDPTLYDLTVNLDKLSPETAADLIIRSAGAEEVKSCSYKAMESMENLSLAHKVETQIIKENFNLSSLVVEVFDKNEVTVTGWVPGEGQRDKLADVIDNVPGVAKVHLNVAHVSYS